MTLNPREIAADFDNLGVKIHGKHLSYLDNAATTLKPRVVAEAVDQHFRYGTANVHRGVHWLSEQATQKFEDARLLMQRFIGARYREEVIFTSGTTGALNTIALSLSRTLREGDEILVSEMEHHSNIVPWQLVAKDRGLVVHKIPLLPSGDLDLEAYYKALKRKTRVVALTYVSNALGTINPVREMIHAAHEVGAMVVLDAAQAVGHMAVDVKALDCDFLALSGHKMYGPTGVGILYGKKELLTALPPAQGGGGMIRTVSFGGTTFAGLPERFEAGTPPIAEAIGMGQAAKYLMAMGMDAIEAYEEGLAAYAAQALGQIKGVRIIGSPKKRTGIFSFVIDGIHPHDVGSLLDQEGVAIRSGHHCCQPVMDYFHVPATSRASLSFYNTTEDIDNLCAAIVKAQELFA